MQIQIAKDAEQPGLGSASIAKLFELRLGFAKRFLGQVVGIRRIAAKSESVSVERFGVKLYQLLYASGNAGSHAKPSSIGMSQNGTVYSPVSQEIVTNPYQLSWQRIPSPDEISPLANPALFLFLGNKRKYGASPLLCRNPKAWVPRMHPDLPPPSRKGDA
jgi:hypothetical protein